MALKLRPPNAVSRATKVCKCYIPGVYLTEVNEVSNPRAKLDMFLRAMNAESEGLPRYGCIIEMNTTELGESANVLNGRFVLS